MGENQERFARQIKKGVMEMLVLELLAKEPGYGYELLTRLGQAPGGTLQVKEGTLYPILYRLEEEGMLKSDWQAGPSRAVPKKVYTITPAGLSLLEEQKKAWQQFRQDVAFVLDGKEQTDEI